MEAAQMSSVTEVAVPTSDFDGNAPANGSRDMASTFSESLYWRRSARRYELLGLVSWMLAALSCVVFLAILLAARNLLLPGFALVPVACGLACVGCWCDRNSRDAWDVPSRGGEAMTVTVGARSLDNEERSNFRDYMSLLSLSVDASMTVREIMAVA